MSLQIIVGEHQPFETHGQIAPNPTDYDTPMIGSWLSYYQMPDWYLHQADVGDVQATYELVYDGGSLISQAKAIPEASTYAMLVIGFVFLVWLNKRRQSR